MTPKKFRDLLTLAGALLDAHDPEITKEQLLATALMELDSAGVIDLDEVVALLE